MKKHGETNKLKAEELERRMAPGRLGHIDPPELPEDNGGGSRPVGGNPEPEPEPRKVPARTGGHRQRLFQRE